MKSVAGSFFSTAIALPHFLLLFLFLNLFVLLTQQILGEQIVCDLETGASRGFAFVKFQDPRDAEDVLRECDGKVMAVWY